MDPSHRRGFVENGVKGPVFLPVFLNEIQVLPALAGYARDAQRGKQPEFQNALAGDQRLIRDRRAAEQVIVLPDYGFDVVAAVGEKAASLLPTCGGGRERARPRWWKTESPPPCTPPRTALGPA